MFEIDKNVPFVPRTPKTPEKNRANYKRWRLANAEQALQRVQQWRQKNKSKNAERVRRWRAKHPDLTIAIRHNYRARQRGNGGSFTVLEWRELKKQCNGYCLCCHQKRKLVPDHVIPLSKGGTNDIENIQPLCESCNGKKSSKIQDFRLRDEFAPHP